MATNRQSTGEVVEILTPISLGDTKEIGRAFGDFVGKKVAEDTNGDILACVSKALSTVSILGAGLSLTFFTVGLQQKDSRALRWGFGGLILAITADMGHTYCQRKAARIEIKNWNLVR